MFKKAKPLQARLKVSLYGPPGSGKTFTSLLVAEGLAAIDGKRIAYVDTERGTDFYAQQVDKRQVHPAAFDFDAIYTRSLSEVIRATHALDPKVYGVIVIDSVSHLWDAAIAAFEGKMVGRNEDKIPFSAWATIKKPFKVDLVRWLIDSPFHVFLLGRQKNIFEDNPETGEFSKIGVGMRAEGETEYEPHICLRMESRKGEANQGQQVIYAICEKDRTGILAGRTFPNPGFKVFEPILPLLGETQAQSEDPDEVAAQDSELIDAQREARVAKEQKSAELVEGYRSEITVAKDVEALKAIAARMKKDKKYLMPDHQEALNSAYRRKANQLTAVEG